MVRLIRLFFIAIFILWLGVSFADIDEMGTTPVENIDEAGTTPIENIDEAGTTPIGAIVDDCSGSLMFSWHMENADIESGSPTGCSDGDTTGSSAGTPGFSEDYKIDGTYSLLINALDEGYTFTATDLINLDDAKITFSIYVTSFPQDGSGTGYHEIFNFHYSDWQNMISGTIYEDGERLIVKRYGQGTDKEVLVSISTDAWYTCEYQVKVGVAGNDHYLDCGGPLYRDENDDDHTAAANSGVPDYFLIGDIYGDAPTAPGVYYIDNLKIYPSDRY